MEMEQHIDSRCVALFHWRRRVAHDQALFAQVLDQQQPLFEIGLHNLRRGETLLS